MSQLTLFGSRLGLRSFCKLLSAAVLSLSMLACNQDSTPVAPPPPSALSETSTGYFCTMNLYEHVGPKGQIQLRDSEETVWFSTITQVFAFLFLPEEAKAVTAVYVQDMGLADAQGNPPDDAWIEARNAHYVIKSRFVGGMGGHDALPFLDAAAAQDFVSRYGGEVIAFDEMPEDYVFGIQHLE